VEERGNGEARSGQDPSSRLAAARMHPTLETIAIYGPRS